MAWQATPLRMSQNSTQSVACSITLCCGLGHTFFHRVPPNGTLPLDPAGDFRPRPLVLHTPSKIPGSAPATIFTPAPASKLFGPLTQRVTATARFSTHFQSMPLRQLPHGRGACGALATQLANKPYSGNRPSSGWPNATGKCRN